MQRRLLRSQCITFSPPKMKLLPMPMPGAKLDYGDAKVIIMISKEEMLKTSD